MTAAAKAAATSPVKPIALRPRMIRELYGIPTSSLAYYYRDMPEADRLPSIKIPGRCGRKGVRLIMVADLEAWLERFRVKPAGGK